VREPGFILIDRVNEMNNNWWARTSARNHPLRDRRYPARDQARHGPIGDLHVRRRAAVTSTTARSKAASAARSALRRCRRSAPPSARGVSRRFRDGYEIKAHRVARPSYDRGTIKLRERASATACGCSGKGSSGTRVGEDLGMLLGRITGDGHSRNRWPWPAGRRRHVWGAGSALADP